MQAHGKHSKGSHETPSNGSCTDASRSIPGASTVQTTLFNALQHHELDTDEDNNTKSETGPMSKVSQLYTDTSEHLGTGL